MTPLQPSLFPDKDGVREAWEKFHAAHPEVYMDLRELCLDYRRFTSRKWSIWAAFNVLRWQRVVKGLPDLEEDFKLNNNYTPFYARLLMAQTPELKGMFELRRTVHV